MDRTGQTPSAVPLLSQPKWLSLSQVTRAALVRIFGLTRSASTETYMGRDSQVRVVSDGYTAQDLLAVTTERMQEILDTDRKDFYELFDEIVAKIESPEKIPEEPVRTPVVDSSENQQHVPEEIKDIIKRRGRPRRNEQTT